MKKIAASLAYMLIVVLIAMNFIGLKNALIYAGIEIAVTVMSSILIYLLVDDVPKE